jgi:hypothetical protein
VSGGVASFYDEVLRELLTAVGASLFFANLYALLRRGRDRERTAEVTVARARPGSPVRSPAHPGEPSRLAQAPIGRSLAYLVLGFLVMVAGVASLTR